MTTSRLNAYLPKALMFCSARSSKRPVSPARRAASPSLRSSGPRMAKGTPSAGSTRALALEVREGLGQLVGHLPLEHRLLADGGHDLERVDLLGADPEAVAARRAQPEVGVVDEVVAAQHLHVQLARAVAAHVLDGADRDALATLVAVAQRLPAVEAGDPLHALSG